MRRGQGQGQGGGRREDGDEDEDTVEVENKESKEEVEVEEEEERKMKGEKRGIRVMGSLSKGQKRLWMPFVNSSTSSLGPGRNHVRSALW